MLVDIAQVLEGQKVILILQSPEDVILLRERLKVIKDIDIQEFKHIDIVDIEAETNKNNSTHIIFIIDDLLQI